MYGSPGSKRQSMVGTLNWDVEALCEAAWPALEEERVAGWTLKYAAGVSRRSNSANPTPDAVHDLVQVAPAAETFFRARDLPCRFRILSFLPPQLDRWLAMRGYEIESGTRTLQAAGIGAARQSGRTSLTAKPDAGWIQGVTAAQGREGAEREIYSRIIARLTVSTAFAVTRNDAGEAASWAFGAITAHGLCIESVATRPDQRGRGLAGETVSALMAWGASHRAGAAFLQVQADNHAAIRVYGRLGFDRELYRYHYRTLATGPV
ncbi:MAG TPA: GNAT family N-acetyltransferase [Rhizomicrobium sp.]|nr:GNAT family N-acetyltransferase [Rhizomicrobium sp.]